MNPRYESPAALESAVKDIAKNSDLNTAFAIESFYRQRLLARLFKGDSPFVLKGGMALLARSRNARTSRDIDLATSDL